MFGLVERFKKYLWEKERSIFVPYSHVEGIDQFASAYEKIRVDKDICHLLPEAFLVYQLALKTAKIGGAIAECGVYKGGNAKIICEAKRDRELHLFDTWEGMPFATTYCTRRKINVGEFKVDVEDVKKYLSAYKNVFFHKGVFQETSKSMGNTEFGLAVIDFDTYESILAAMHFFYGRMRPGGAIVVHDYLIYEDVKLAVNEFMQDKPEFVLEINNSQALIIKSG